MDDANQTPAPPLPEDEPPHGPRIGVAQALLAWLIALVVFGIGGFLLDQQELALLAATSGIFITAQAADESHPWRPIYFMLGWVVPLLGVVLSIAVGMSLWRSELSLPLRATLAAICVLAAGASTLTVPTPIGDRLARWLFRVPESTHVLRLTARSVAIGLTLAVPGWFAAQLALPDLLAAPEPLMDRVGLGGGLLGYVLLAFAGVGFLVRRDFRASAERLGLAWPGGRSLIVAAIALGALWVLNEGSDALQGHFFPALQAADRRVTESIAAGMNPWRVALLGLSAGIGEEITLRGALQPKLGIVLTSVLFGALHVQYSWFGMLVILVLGLILGWVRKTTNTTTAILAHAAYDMLAVITN